MILALLTALATPQPAPAPASTDVEVPMATVGAGYRKASPVLTTAVQEALAERAWPEVAAALGALDGPLDANAKREAAFLEAWAWIRADQPEKAAALLPKFRGVLTVPAPYVDLVVGEAQLAAGDNKSALEALSRVPPSAGIFPRAAVLRAETLKKLERTKEASEVFESIVDRADPAPGNALGLLALAKAKGPGSPGAYPYLRRLWTHHPETREGEEAKGLLRKYSGKEYAPTADGWSKRAERWMYARSYRNAIEATSNIAITGDDKSEAACRALYVRGRSWYKENQLTNAISAFEDAGTRCVGVDGAYGPRALYLTGTAQFRKKQYKSSAATFSKIPALYPEHSMADDGYTHAGISLQEGGDLAGAQAQWLKALDELPNGDTAAEATWRLAWSLYLDGKPAEAREIAARLAKLDVAIDAVHVDAGRYWHARWAMYPDVSDPSAAVDAGKTEAVAGWKSLLEERPFSFYSILAAARLKEVDPDGLAAINIRGERAPIERAWNVRQEWLEHPGVIDGAALARIGLAWEARTEWKRFDEPLLPDEKALLIESRILAGDWLLAHDDFRRWIRSHPVGSLGEGERAIVRVAYPDRYWQEVQDASKPYGRFEPRLFHSLVREESNFNREIVSFAGARGLSQLMPATAQLTAGWLKQKITMTELFIPEKNLPIGARYLEQVFKQLDDSPYCALAGYNAGPARVSKWGREWGNPPTDEFVERIPFRETRGYVKRVMGTWQTYRWYIDDGSPFPDLSAYNHKMLPE